MMAAGDTVPDPSILTTEQLFRETKRLSERFDRQDDWLTAVQADLVGLTANFKGLVEKQNGDISRLSSEITWSNRSVDSAQESHAKLHAINEKQVDIAREQQEYRNQSLNNDREIQSKRDKEFARSETVTLEVSSIRTAMNKNEGRVRELELGLRAMLAEDTGAAGNKRSGQATVQQIAAVVGVLVAVITIVITVILATR